MLATAGASPNTVGIVVNTDGVVTGRSANLNIPVLSADGVTTFSLLDCVWGQKTLVADTATSLFDVALANNSWSSGLVFYTIKVGDGTDFQAITGMVTYSTVSKIAVMTLAATEVAGNQAKSVSSGTLVPAWTNVAGTLKSTIKVAATGSLTETIYQVVYVVIPFLGAVTIV